MWTKIKNIILGILSLWGLIVLGVFCYQSWSISTLQGPQLNEIGPLNTHKERQILLAHASQSFSYIQEKSFLKSLIGFPRAAVKYNWQADFSYGTTLPDNWSFEANYKEGTLYVKVPPLKLLKTQVKESKVPEVIYRSLFFSLLNMQREVDKQRSQLLHEKGLALIPQLHDQSEQALSKMLENFLKSLNLNEDVQEVKVEIQKENE